MSHDRTEGVQRDDFAHTRHETVTAVKLINTSPHSVNLPCACRASENEILKASCAFVNGRMGKHKVVHTQQNVIQPLKGRKYWRKLQRRRT